MIAIIDFAWFVLERFPSIKTNLKIAHYKKTPEQFVKRAFRLALYAALTFTIMAFFLLAKKVSFPALIALMLLVFSVSLIFTTLFVMQSPKAAIRRRQREIDKEVLFAGRYLLVKIESGTPLINTLEDASKSYGVSAKYFGEILHDINTGTPLETALENARTYNSSEKFKRVLWQIVTALKTGSEVSGVLKSTLKSIASEQSIEIKSYGKKLNSLMLFYMIIGCVAPSLGLTMLVIISGFLNLEFTNTVFYTVLFFLSVVQIAFIVMVRSIRPMVQL